MGRLLAENERKNPAITRRLSAVENGDHGYSIDTVGPSEDAEQQTPSCVPQNTLQEEGPIEQGR